MSVIATPWSNNARLASRGAVGPTRECSTEPSDHQTPTWRVVHTRSRQEKALAEALTAAGIDHYLPLARRVKTYGHRRRVTLFPLFSCYVFLRGTDDDTRFALETGRAVRALRVADPARLERELASIRLALGAGAELTPHSHLRPGRRARVVRGPFKGVEGVVEALQGRYRLALLVHALNQSTSLEVDAADLESVV